MLSAAGTLTRPRPGGTTVATDMILNEAIYPLFRPDLEKPTVRTSSRLR